jgi:DTW domain-containing protein YfiP
MHDDFVCIMEDQERRPQPSSAAAVKGINEPEEGKSGVDDESHDAKRSSSSRSDNKKSRAVCSRCHRPTPQACICEALPDALIALETTEVVVLQHPLEVKQHKATANRSVPLLELCLSPQSLHLCTERRLGDDIDGEILDKLHRRPDQYLPVLVFPRLKVDSENAKMEIVNLNQLVSKIQNKRNSAATCEENDDTKAMGVSTWDKSRRKILLVVLDATWKYAREMHMANQKYHQYPSHMIQLALEKEDLPMEEGDNQYRPRRFEIRGKVSATGGKQAAQEEDTTTTWMCTAECIALIVSRLEEELSQATMPPADAAKAISPRPSLHAVLMKPLDAMVVKWKAFVTASKNRKHDLERGQSKKSKRNKRQQQQT